MVNRRARALLAALLLPVTGAACAVDARFGDLPAGPISVSQTDDVVAEICRDHLFDPAAETAKLPAGFRLILAAEAAANDPALRTLLQAHPKLGGHAIGSLCFASVGRFAIDGRPVHAANPMPIAFWWASAEGPRDANMRGKASWVQLGSWYPSGASSRSSILETDPMAEFVDVEVEQVGPNRWRMRLVLPGETVTADVSSSGRRVPSRAEQPAYMSVPMSGRAAGYFSVFTYYGHHQQSAQGVWRANGAGVFSDAFGIPGEAGSLGTVFQDGWSSRAGLYRFSAK